MKSYNSYKFPKFPKFPKSPNPRLRVNLANLITIWAVVFLIIYALQPDHESRIDKLCQALAKPSKVAWMAEDDRCYFVNPTTSKWEDVTPLLDPSAKTF